MQHFNNQCEISVLDAFKKLYEDSDSVLIDVRTYEEYYNCHVRGSVLIPLDSLDSKIHDLDKDKKYFLICKSGGRSMRALTLFFDLGFRNVFNVTGGITQWVNIIDNTLIRG